MSRHAVHLRGFSLIELMCSMAIGATILVAAAALLGSSGEGYERVGGGVAAEREARALMTQLSADLATAKFHKDGIMEKSGDSWAKDRIGFLSLQPIQAQTKQELIGDLCAVHYYIDDIKINGKIVRCLMRGFKGSNPTFEALKSNTVPSLFSKPSPGTLSADEPVAFGVVAFEARPKSRDSTGKWIDWVRNDIIGPEALDIRIVVARRELTGKLTTSGDWDGAGKSGKLLGNPTETDRNKSLEEYGTLIRFGSHETS
jgi:prepilin-type N-terminal cleavage/methylation domain-containing protein